MSEREPGAGRRGTARVGRGGLSWRESRDRGRQAEQTDRQPQLSPAQSSPPFFLLVGFPVCSFTSPSLSFFWKKEERKREIDSPPSNPVRVRPRKQLQVRPIWSLLLHPFRPVSAPLFYSLSRLACVFVCACLRVFVPCACCAVLFCLCVLCLTREQDRNWTGQDKGHCKACLCSLYFFCIILSSIFFFRPGVFYLQPSPLSISRNRRFFEGGIPGTTIAIMLVEVSFYTQRFFSHFVPFLFFSRCLLCPIGHGFIIRRKQFDYALFLLFLFLGHRAREAQAQKPGAARREGMMWFCERRAFWESRRGWRRTGEKS